MVKIFVTAYLVFCVIFLSACPKNATVRDFKNQSAKLKIYGLKLQVATNNAYRDGIVSRQQLGFLTNCNEKVRLAVKGLDLAVKTAEQMAQDGAEKPDILAMLDKVLSEEVVKAFDALVEALTGNSIVGDRINEYIVAIRAALSALRLLIASNGGPIHATA
jgi:hypothetical protein